MATKKKTEPTTVDLPTIGQEGDTCEECGAALATDQRYCLNCGTRRGASRLDYEQVLHAGPVGANGNGAMALAPAQGGRIPAVREWNPITAVGAIAVLGAMLLLGVLIGKDNNNTTQVTAAPTGTTAAAAAPTTPTASTPANDAKNKAAAAAGAPAGGAVKGGSGTTAGIPTAAAPQTGKAASDNSAKTPDQVATPGNLPQQDPNGQAGGGSSATCIGAC